MRKSYIKPGVGCLSTWKKRYLVYFYIFLVIIINIMIVLLIRNNNLLGNHFWKNPKQTNLWIDKKSHLMQTNKFIHLPERFVNKVEEQKLFVFSQRPWKYLKDRNTSSFRYFMTFIVKTSAKFAGRRFLVRRTWGSIDKINNKNFGLIFLIGNITDEDEKKKIEEENSLYGDILQTDAGDGYNDLPQKLLSSFQYVVDVLGDISDFFVTGDDDCYVNFPSIYDYFASDTNQKKKVIHCGFSYDIDAKPSREVGTKWYMSPELYPAEYYPPFCHGGMVILTYQHIEGLFAQSLVTNTTGFVLEDVLIFGILRHKLQRGDDFRIVPYGYNSRPTLFGVHEKLVFHLGLERSLEKKMLYYWNRSLRSFNFKVNNPSVRKTQISKSFATTLKRFVTFENKSIDETISYFTSFWDS